MHLVLLCGEVLALGAYHVKEDEDKVHERAGLLWTRKEGSR